MQLPGYCIKCSRKVEPFCLTNTTSATWSDVVITRGVEPEDKVKTHGADAPGPSRGRTLERVPQNSTCSRNSSASSARSMIDERIKWANAERSRSFSRPAPEPASPFRESSPYHPDRQKSKNGVWDKAQGLPSTKRFEPFYSDPQAGFAAGKDVSSRGDRREAQWAYVTCS
jgi:hypothetical protein